MMATASPHTLIIRPIQHGDLDAIQCLLSLTTTTQSQLLLDPTTTFERFRRWYGLIKILNLFPNPAQYSYCGFVAEVAGRVCGLIQVSPFNCSHSTWRVEGVIINPLAIPPQIGLLPTDIGSQLLRYCFEEIWQARTWLVEVNANDSAAIALYRHNGFQSLAHITHWSIPPTTLSTLAQREPHLPNLLPISNADAKLLYQLDTAAMPPLVRQVFDRHIHDFHISFWQNIMDGLRQRTTSTQLVNGYVFEPQRKAAIGYFRLEICEDGSRPHLLDLTVHPAYTSLYLELLCQISRLVQSAPPQLIQLSSTDYQTEREEYLVKIGAERIEHTLMMSRSVWHKLRETKGVNLEMPLSEMLQSLKPVRKPVPSRISIDSAHRWRLSHHSYPFVLKSHRSPHLKHRSHQSLLPRPDSESTSHSPLDPT
jgi:predicted N-acetyltransferase YhbS